MGLLNLIGAITGAVNGISNISKNSNSSIGTTAPTTPKANNAVNAVQNTAGTIANTLTHKSGGSGTTVTPTPKVKPTAGAIASDGNQRTYLTNLINGTNSSTGKASTAGEISWAKGELAKLGTEKKGTVATDKPGTGISSILNNVLGINKPATAPAAGSVSGDNQTDYLTNLINGHNVFTGKASTAGEIQWAKNELAKQNTSKPAATVASPATPTATITHADGSKETGYVKDGVTTTASGARVTTGDKVLVGGKTYLMTDSGKGIAISNNNLGHVWDVVTNENGVTKLEPVTDVYIDAQGRSYDGKTGQRYTTVGTATQVVQDVAGRYWNLADGTPYTPPDAENLAEIKPSTMTEAEFADFMSQVGATYGINDLPTLDEYLTWEQAYARANENLTPQYNAATNSALNTLNQNALKTGFFGQLPTEALKAQALASAEAQKQSAINSLAGELQGASEDSAYKKLGAANTATNTKLSTLDWIYNLINSYNQKKTDDAQTAVENAQTNRQLDISEINANK